MGAGERAGGLSTASHRTALRPTAGCCVGRALLTLAQARAAEGDARGMSTAPLETALELTRRGPHAPTHTAARQGRPRPCADTTGQQEHPAGQRERRALCDRTAHTAHAHGAHPRHKGVRASPRERPASRPQTDPIRPRVSGAHVSKHGVLSIKTHHCHMQQRG